MQEGGQRVFLLVVEAGENASLCIIAQPTFVAMNKTFYFSEAIKVMNDRLAPIQKNVMDESSLTDLKLEAIS